MTLVDLKVTDIKKIACLGSGVIGASWATNFVLNGYQVNLYDVVPEALEAGIDKVEDNLRFLQEEGFLAEEQVEHAVALVHGTTSMEEALEGVQWVQESVPERYEIKQAVLQQIDELAEDHVVYASSTSGLLISKIAELSKYPERCIGAHPYNPPHLVPLVELVAPEGADKTVSLAYDFYRSLGKEPVVLHKEVPGFIANRIQTAVAREIIDLVMHGVCSVEDADKALTFGPGIRWGIMGQNLLYYLGNPNGIKGLYQNIGGGKNKKSWLEDMARWTVYPDGWPDIAQQGVEEEIARRPEEIGNDRDSLTRYRDKMLLQMLRLHGKV